MTTGESKIWRAFRALPLLGAAYYCRQYLFASILHSMGPTIANALESGIIPTRGEGGNTSVPLRSPYFGIKPVDDFLRIFVLAFTPAIAGLNRAQQLQMLVFLLDLTSVQIIWAIEARRRGNWPSVIAVFPTVFACFYQLEGIGVIGPLYYFFHYLQTPQENYQTGDGNLTVPIADAKVLIPAIAIGYVAPTVAMFLPYFSLETRQWINGALWQPFPIWSAIVLRIFRSFVSDTRPQARDRRPDLPYLRYAYWFAGVVSAGGYIYLHLTNLPALTRQIFFGGLGSPLEMPVTSVFRGWRRFLQWDQIVAFGAGLYWEVLHFHDLKRVGKIKTGYVSIVGCLTVATLLFGPGAAMAWAWGWREEVMARRHEKQT